MAIQLHLVAESRTIFSSRSKRPVRKLLDTPSILPVVNNKKYECVGSEMNLDTPCSLTQNVAHFECVALFC